LALEPTHHALTAVLSECIAERADVEAASLTGGTDLSRLGLKSVDIVLISGRIEDCFGIAVDPMVFFDNNTIETICDAILAARHTRETSESEP